MDYETYKKYRKTRDEELSPLLDKYITRNRTAKNNSSYFAKIKLNPGASCPFLDKKMLCRIQLRRVESYLSDVCTTYPRVVNVVNGILERSATMSCPEAARVALLDPDPMKFDAGEEVQEFRNIIKTNLKTDDIK